MRTVYAGTTEESVHKAILNLSNDAGDSFSSVIAASGSNNVYVAWIDDTPGYKAVFLARSIDGGTSFKNATILSNNNTLPEELQIATSGSNLYVTWYVNESGNFEPFLAISRNNGTSFSNPINLSEEAGVHNNDAVGKYGLFTSFSQIAASGDNLYAIWYDNSTGSVETFLTRSTDSGISFSDPINLSQKAKGGTFRDIAVAGNNVYVLWAIRGGANSADPNLQFLLSKSADEGRTFSESVMVTNAPEFSGPPRLAVSGINNVYLSWQEDTIEKGTMRVLSSKISLVNSTDGGTTFSEPVNMIESKSFINSDFNIGAAGNNLYTVWSMDVGGGQLVPGLGILPEEHIFVAKNTDRGTTFKKPMLDVGNGRFPDIAASDGNWYVCWGFNIGNSEIFFTKGTGSQSQLTDATIGAAPTTMQQLKQHLQEAYVAAQDNDTLSVLGALDDANRSLLLVERNTPGLTENNNSMTDHIDTTITDRSSGGQAHSLLIYQNFKEGVKIKYPSDWQVREDPNLVAIFTSATNSNYDAPEILNIAIEYLPSKILSLDRYTSAAISKLRFLQDFNMTESEDATLAGFPAHKIIYTVTVPTEGGSYPLKNMQIWTVKDGKAYIVTYGGVQNQFFESWSDAQKMVDSFEIVKLGSPPPTISAQGRIG
jgi:hypothetical protein